MFDTWEQDGFTIEARTESDEDHGAPWEECDGHGDVSEWTTRDKLPGELILSQDGQLFRYYDFAGACQIARRDGWDAKPYNDGSETKRQQAAKAARADYEYLRKWCDGVWQYVGVVVNVERAGVTLTDDYAHALWGIESDSGEYLSDVARELTLDAIDAAREKLAELVE